MKLREELSKELYDIVVNNNLYPEFSNTFSEALDKSNLLLGEKSEAAEQMNDKIVILAHDAFITGISAILDAITGKAGDQHA